MLVVVPLANTSGAPTIIPMFWLSFVKATAAPNCDPSWGVVTDKLDASCHDPVVFCRITTDPGPGASGAPTAIKEREELEMATDVPYLEFSGPLKFPTRDCSIENGVGAEVGASVGYTMTKQRRIG